MGSDEVRPLNLEKSSTVITTDVEKSEKRNLENKEKYSTAGLVGPATGKENQNESDTLQAPGIKLRGSGLKDGPAKEARIAKKLSISFNIMYNAYSAKVLRLIEKK